MAEYLFDLDESEYLLSEHYRPIARIKTTHEGTVLGYFDLTESGLVVMNLPDDLVHRLNAGAATILAWSQIGDARHVGNEIQTKQIYHFEIIDSPY